MKLPLQIDLSPEQAAAVNAALRPGVVLLARVGRIWIGDDPATDARAGQLFIELGECPESCIPALRKVITDARETPAGKPKRKDA